MSQHTPRPFWVELKGRKRRFATMGAAVAAADLFFSRTGIMVGIQHDDAA